MSESAFGGESVPDWYRYGDGVFEDDVPLRGGVSGESAGGESAPNYMKPTQVPKQQIRVIRGAEESEQEDTIYDIGELRKKVMEELYDEFFTDIKNEVKEELLKEKPVIVREITDELREKLKADLRKSFIKSEDGGR